MKIEVGKKVSILKRTFSREQFTSENIVNSGRILDTKIIKVGRIYFYVEGIKEGFNIDDLEQNCDSNYKDLVFESKKEIVDSFKKRELYNKIRSEFTNYSLRSNCFTILQLGYILDVIRKAKENI